MPVTRLSRGRYGAESHTKVARELAAGAEMLVPAISALPGLLHYYVGIDERSGTMVNISVWVDETAAQQMATLQPMLDQREKFLALGVSFDPIVNYAPVWDIAP